LGAFGYGNDFFAREFWRFVLVQQHVGKLALTAVDLLTTRLPSTSIHTAIQTRIERPLRSQANRVATVIASVLAAVC